MYLLSLLCCYFLVYEPSNIKVLVLNLFSLQIFDWDFNTINVPSWSIGEEFIFYFLFPYLFPFFDRLRSVQLAIALGVFFMIGLLLHTAYFGYIFQKMPFWVWNLQPFFYGIVIGIFYKRGTFNVHLSNYSIYYILLALALFWVTIAQLNRTVFNGLPYFCLLSSLFILALSNLPTSSLLHKMMSSKAAVFAGEISYSMYIAQIFIHYLFTS